MSVARKRAVYSPEFKAKVGLEALRCVFRAIVTGDFAEA
jgi:hypothetical protein